MPERFSHLFEHLPEALLVVEKGVVADANRAAGQLYHCPPEALVGHPLLDLWADAERGVVADQLDALRRRGPLIIAGHGRRFDGSTFAQEMRLAGGADADDGRDAGRAGQLYVVARDLTERQQLESGLAGLADLARLHEQEGTLATVAGRALRLTRKMLGAERGLICSFSAADTIEWLADHRLRRLAQAAAGLRPEQIGWLQQALETGQPQLIDRRTAGRVRSPLSDVADQLGVAAFAVVPLHVGNELIGIMGVTWAADPPELANDREILAAIGRLVGLDLSNVRLRDSLLARQQALDESEERYRSLFHEAPEPILLQSADGLVIDANAAACAVFGRRRRDLLGTTTAEIWSLDRDRRARMRAQLRRRGRATARGQGVRPDGRTFPLVLHVAVTTLRGEQRQLVQVRDLTEQERMQAELLQAQKMEALGQLISGVAHELNNPLSAIIAFSQLLRSDERLPAELARDADLLMHEADRTRRIVQNLLDFARQRPPEREPTDLAALIDRTLELHSYALGAAQIAVHRDVPADLPPIDADPGQIQQVLLNLTLNAIQAIGSRPGGGNIAISAALALDGSARRVRLTISDDGAGIGAAARGRLFEPFFTTKPVGQGTGLGLPVSYGIISGHGGRLWHETDAAPGTTFIFELPASDAPPSETSSGPGWAPVAIAVGDAPRGRILAVDDEPAVRQMIERALTRVGYEVVVAEGGRDALERIAQDDIDLLLVDHRMADVDGITLYRRLVDLHPPLAGRAVLMSGDTLNPELQQFAASSGVRMLAKPFDVGSLLAVIEEELGRRRAAARA